VSALNQKTINNPININGVGGHTGKMVSIRILPAEANTGIIFKRIDLKNNNIIIPNVFNVSNAKLCTTISNENGAQVSTIEHLMGAFFGLGIDNAIVEVDAEEIPILDGSAKIFVEKIRSAGIKTSNYPIKIIKIEKKINHVDNEKSISIEPNKINLEIDFEIKYNNKLIGQQKNVVKPYETDLTEIYNARTFCLYEDIERLKAMGLGLGGSLDNAIVVKGEKILNKEGLRSEKEFVNHKILDCLGDIYLSGYKILGKIVCSQGGHQLTNQLLRKVFSNKENYSIIEIQEKNIPHTAINRNPLRSIA